MNIPGKRCGLTTDPVVSGPAPTPAVAQGNIDSRKNVEHRHSCSGRATSAGSAPRTRSPRRPQPLVRPPAPPPRRPPEIGVAADAAEDQRANRPGLALETTAPTDSRCGEATGRSTAASFVCVAGAAQPDWQPFYIDPAGEAAKGILLTHRTGHVATISHGSETGLIWIKVTWGQLVKPLSAGQALLLLEQQSLPRLSRVVYDSEDKTIALLGVAGCPSPAMIKVVVQALIQDLIRALDDDYLSTTLGANLAIWHSGSEEK